MTALEQYDSDLDAYILGEIEFDPEVPPPTPEDRAEVDKLMWKVAKLGTEQSDITAMFDARRDDIRRKAADLIADLDADEAELLEPLERERRWLLQSAEQWTRAHIAPNAKKKTIPLTRGRSLSLKAKQTTLSLLADEPKPSVPEQFRIVQTITKWASKTDIKKLLTPGPEMDADDLPDGFEVPEGYTPHKALFGDEKDAQVVPDAVLLVPDEDAFRYKAAG